MRLDKLTAAAVVTSLGILGMSAPSWGAPFVPGNLVVVQVGDGSAALNNTATATFLREFSTTGTAVQTINLPTAVDGSQRQLTLSGTATSEGFLTRSADGQYLTLGGYGAAPGTASVTSSIGNRVVGRVDLAGNVDTSTVLNDAASIGNIRSTVSSNGTDIWVGSSSGGVRYTTFGSTAASTQLNTAAPTNTRVVNIDNSQLYVSSSSGTFQGVGTVGTGLPTTSGQTLTLLPGFPTAAGPSAYDYLFADSSTLYVADDRTTANGGGLQKWILSSGTWSLAYTLNTGLTAGLRGLTGTTDGSGNSILYATSADTLSKLVAITDMTSATTSAGQSFSVLATAATNTAFRGVEFIPAAATPTNSASISIVASPTLGSVAVNGDAATDSYGIANAAAGGALAGSLGITGTLATAGDTPVLVYLDLAGDGAAASAVAAALGTGAVGTYSFGTGVTYDLLLTFNSNPGTGAAFSYDFTGITGAGVNNIGVVPEPAVMGLAGIAAVLGVARRRRA